MVKVRPLSYLVLIGQSGPRPGALHYTQHPRGSRAELASSRAPSAIRQWIAQPPPWLVIDSTFIALTSRCASPDTSGLHRMTDGRHEL